MSAEERRAVVNKRLLVVTEEIFRIFEMMMGGFEVSRSHQENERQCELVNVTWKTETRWSRTDNMPSSGSEQQKCSNRPRFQDAWTQTDSEFINGKPSHFQTRPVGKDTRTETETEEEHCGPNDGQEIKSSQMQTDAESSDGESDEDWTKSEGTDGDKNQTKEGARLQDKKTRSQGSDTQRRSPNKHCKDLSDLKYICKVCDKSFCYRASFLKHVQEHKSGTDVCGLCGKHFETEESLRLHWSQATGRSCCRVCGKLFRCNRSFLKHVLTHEQSTDVCGVCGKHLDSDDGLKLHLQTHNKENRCRDQMDPRESEGESDEDWRNSEGSDSEDGGSKKEEGTQGSCLQKESKAKPKESKNKDLSHLKYCCKVCGKSFCYRASFLKHVQEDERQAGLCGVCGKHFGTEESLRLHLQTYVRSNDCKVCGKHFDGHRQLEMHTRTHTGEKPFVCSVCGKTFAQSGNLTGHMKVHTGEKPYVCSVCGQSFSFKEYMRAHMRIHTGERPFLCSMCGKGFRQKGTLKTHMMIHTGESTHRCLVCDKKFYKSGALKIHMRSHTGERPYLCNVCGKSFSAGGTLTKHMGVIHTADDSLMLRGSAVL